MKQLLILCFILGFGFTTILYAKTSPKVEIVTSMGNIVIELYPQRAPKTVNNFLTYIKEGFYNNTIFHRVIPGFMIQGGGFTTELERKKTHKPIKNESNNSLSNTKGTIAMARTSHPHSATSQFFINVSDNSYLNYNRQSRSFGYTVFGKVTHGLEIVEAISQKPTEVKGHFKNLPMTPIIIKVIHPLTY